MKNCGAAPHRAPIIRSLKTSATADALFPGMACMRLSRNGLPLSFPEVTFRRIGSAIAVSPSLQAGGRALKAFRPLPDMRTSRRPCTTTRRPSLWPRQAPYLMKNNYFTRLCFRKWLMLFSLKFQGITANALAVDPAKGKTGEKAVFSPHCGDETTTNYNKDFHYIGVVDTQPFTLHLQAQEC
mgnify:CR=1 FL=1